MCKEPAALIDKEYCNQQEDLKEGMQMSHSIIKWYMSF